jgi:Tfp pilus assembly pilus retraction ATPase PilT
MPADLVAWLRRVRELDGSDLLLVAGVAPMVKAAGRLVPADDAELDTETIEAAMLPHVPAMAVSRIADAFPAERRNAVRQELAMALAAVLTQTLVPTTSAVLMPAAELLMVSYGARQHVRKNALQHLHQEITITRKAGSFTFEESLARLVQQGRLERSDAVMRAAHTDELESILGRSV